MKNAMWKSSAESRRRFIGGSDARIIMGNDEKAAGTRLNGAGQVVVDLQRRVAISYVATKRSSQ
jgi:hypothetical protein